MEKGRGEEAGWDLHPLWGAEGEERFLYLGKPSHWWRDQLGQKGSFRGSEESPATGLWQAGQSETCTGGLCHIPACPRLRQVSAGVHGGWVLEHGVWRAEPGRGLLLAVRRQPEGMGVRSYITGNACRGSPDHHRSEVPLLSDTQRVGLHCSLSPHVSAPASTGTREGSHNSWLVCPCHRHLPTPPSWPLAWATHPPESELPP